jgi:calcineurin-like phosphoesterase
VDFHRETTAESYVMSEYLDGRASVVYWTHTHIQTNDEHILKNWTWMITDIWMVWPIHSSIGQRFEDRMPQFLTWINIFNNKPEQDQWPWVVNWIYVEIEDKKCIKIEKIRIMESE